MSQTLNKITWKPVGIDHDEAKSKSSHLVFFLMRLMSLPQAESNIDAGKVAYS